jgi:predicted nucleotidyltransferase
MKPFEALDSNRATIREVVASHRACNARVFDSLLRGKGTDGSDLDILIGPRPQTTLMDAGAIQVELQRLIGVSVNVLPLRFCQISFAMQFCQKRRPVDPDTRRARNIGLIQRHPTLTDSRASHAQRDSGVKTTSPTCQPRYFCKDSPTSPRVGPCQPTSPNQECAETLPGKWRLLKHSYTV